MTTVEIDVDALLDRLDQTASQRPIAARIVATTNNDGCGANEVAAILGADVALAARVLKLANSAYFGLSGKVTSLQFGVIVVGFNTVRSIATVALAGIDSAPALPADFWDTSVHLAAAAGALGPAFGERTADTMCLGLLAQLGAALLHQADVDGYDEIVAGTVVGPVRFAAETARYGISSVELTARALQQWRFPATMVDALLAVPDAPEGALLRTAYELTARLLHGRHRRTSLDLLSGRRVPESQASARLAAVRSDVSDLRSALDL